MGIEQARAYLQQWGIQDQILEFDSSSATVELAAQALHCEPGRIAKTLSFLVDGEAFLVVAAGDTKIDNAKFKAQFHTKAKMLTPQQAVDLVGHAVGGVCPFGVKDGVKVYLDVSLQRFNIVYPACGSSNSAIALTPSQLEQYSGSLGWIDTCKLRT
jgi:prolyl-tRNA editing enzyme YbaK/EbsC (Cys-tRNA(Pro) deacylase)